MPLETSALAKAADPLANASAWRLIELLFDSDAVALPSPWA
jgi:hypothetical protein